MSNLLATLTETIESAAPMAAPAAFVWGVLSVFLSPCHLSSIPLIVAFISDRGERDRGESDRARAMAISVAFAVGILITIGLVGVLTAFMGRMLGDLGPYGDYAVAGLFIILGLYFLGVVPLPWTGAAPGKVKRRGLWTAFALGLLFGVGVGPCTFAFMAPVLGVTFKLAGDSVFYGALLVFLYGVGHSSVIVLAGTSVALVQRYLDWSSGSRGLAALRRVCGILVILGGLYVIYTA